ncbi:MAG: helix-hairpin-helix domain-containing protein [Firmicutes bacterium]|nr:helix-hairpin-helix domain-containing protein [Bacillota bacterium]
MPKGIRRDKMKPKQRVVVVILILCALFGHGIRKSTQQQGMNHFFQQADAIASGQDQGVSTNEERHCPLVHINTASMAELQTLPGIGPVLAERIIIERREEPFKEPRDLLRVPGIGEKRLAQLVDLVCCYMDEDE